MPVADHPVHERTRFAEVPLSPCHSDMPDLTRDRYRVLNVDPLGMPRHVVKEIKWFSDNVCKQPDNSLPECRGCTSPTARSETRSP